MWHDIYAWKTAATVAGNYIYEINYKLVVAVFCGASLFVAVGKTKPIKLTGRLRWIGSAASIAIFAYSIYWIGFTNELPSRGIDVNLWDVSTGYEERGYWLSTCLGLKHIIVEEPDNYDTEALKEETLSRNDGIQLPEGVIVPENLFVIMNESLADFRMLGELNMDVELYPFIDSLEKNVLKTQLYVPVHGSGTSNTEYEVLTGNTMQFLPVNSVPYQIYSRKNEYGLPSLLKEQGYHAVAMHPYPATNWNRNNVYDYMGFDEFLTDYTGYDTMRNYVSDRGDYQFLIDYYEENVDKDKLFVFNVTMQNHGGYNYVGNNFEPCTDWLGVGDYPAAEQFLSLVKYSDAAFQYLIEYFEQVEEPTMIVMFGDHQPSIEDGFYEELTGRPMSEWTSEEKEQRYATPLIIWTNYDMEFEELDRISTNYLCSLILESANLDMSPYQELLGEWREEIPVLGRNGVFAADGKYYAYSDLSGELAELLNRYECWEYNYVFDRGGRVDEAFSLEKAG